MSTGCSEYDRVTVPEKFDRLVKVPCNGLQVLHGICQTANPVNPSIQQRSPARVSPQEAPMRRITSIVTAIYLIRGLSRARRAGPGARRRARPARNARGRCRPSPNAPTGARSSTASIRLYWDEATRHALSRDSAAQSGSAVRQRPQRRPRLERHRPRSRADRAARSSSDSSASARRC